MVLFGGLTDIGMSPDGDLLLENNDLKNITGIEWFIQEVIKILKSSNDWYFAPNAGAALDSYHGQNNTREVGRSIEERIKTKITRQGIQFPATLKVQVIPVSREGIKVYISLEYEGQIINIYRVVFDLTNGNIKEEEIDTKNQSVETPNKHPFASRFMFT